MLASEAAKVPVSIGARELFEGDAGSKAKNVMPSELRAASSLAPELSEQAPSRPKQAIDRRQISGAEILWVSEPVLEALLVAT